MFDKILIANRGEIAIRIIRAAKELGIKTVSIYSTADRDSLHVQLADEAVCVGPPPSKESYLNIPRIIASAEITGADAIHPGVGFLAEDGRFAQICEENFIRFIGPSAEVIKRMGDKIEALNLAKKVGIPVLPGSNGPVSSCKEALEIAEKIGYPVMIKAKAGGGGKGIRIVPNHTLMEEAFNTAKIEAESAFPSSEIYIEKYLQEPRHIEVQIMADNYGNIIYLGERECSIQCRYQKLLEEAPSPIVDEKTRKELGNAALKLAKAIKYNNIGTVEFLVDKNRRFYFIELNTRLQIEHPITECVTDIDIVKEQIKLAAGERLSYSQKDIVLRGHAMECRINAADPRNNFIPSSGKIERLLLPSGPGIRVDTHIYAEYTVSTNYDSLLAKLIAEGKDRDECIARMRRALDEFVIEGIKTTIPFHQNVLQDKNFQKGEIHTHFLSYIEGIKRGGD